MDHQNEAVVAAEIKISVTSNSIEEIETLIKKIQDACRQSDYKLNVAIEGDFFKSCEKREPPVEFDGRMAKYYQELDFRE